MSETQTGFQAKFDAIHNFQPIEPPALTVTGEVEVSTLGWSLKLVKQEPQGINPEVLLLELIRTPPDGVAGESVTTETVKYVEQTEFLYTEVTIVPDQVTVPVQNVY